MKLSQFELFVTDVARAENERQVAAILATNLGTNGKKADIERAIRDLTGGGPQPGKTGSSSSIEDMQKFANARHARTPETPTKR